MPPPLPRAPQLRGMGPLDLEELRGSYDVYHSNLPHALGCPRRHLQGLRPDRCFAVALPPHGATNICMQQLHLFIPGKRTADDLVDVWIWWFNLHQPDKAQVCVTHLA